MKWRNPVITSAVATCFAFSAFAQGVSGANQPEGIGSQRYPVMTWPEYKARASAYEVPYVLKCDMPHGGLIYVGSKHTKDPKDPELLTIETLWKQYHPEIAFNEGGNPPVERERDEAIRKWEEPGLVRWLAHRDKIPVKSNEPELNDEVKSLLKKFSAVDLKTFYILRSIPAYYRSPSVRTPLDKYLKGFVSLYSDVPDLKNVPPISLKELATVLTDPLDDANAGTIFNEIARASSDYRDQFMVDTILRTAREKRVFAVVGASHVAMQEPAIRKLLSEKCTSMH